MDNVRELDGCVLTSRSSADGSVVMAACGEIDTVNAKAIRTLLLEAVQSAQVVTLDLGEVEFIDSSGLTAMLSVANAARTSERAFNLARLTPRTQHLLEIAGVVEIFGADGGVDGQTSTPETVSTPAD